MNLPNCVFFLYKDFLFLPINPHPFSHCPSFWLFLPDPETKKGVRGLSGSQVPEFRVPEFASVVSNSVRPHRWQPTRLLCPWDSPGKNTGVGCISFSNAWRWKVKVKSLSHARLLATPWTAAYQDLPSMGFSRQEYRSGLPSILGIHKMYSLYMPSLGI